MYGRTTTTCEAWARQGLPNGLSREDGLRMRPVGPSQNRYALESLVSRVCNIMSRQRRSRMRKLALNCKSRDIDIPHAATRRPACASTCASTSYTSTCESLHVRLHAHLYMRVRIRISTCASTSASLHTRLQATRASTYASTCAS